MKITPGFKHEAKALVTYFAILGAFLYAVNVTVGSLKTDINTAVRVQCLSGNTNTIFEKYNDVVESLVAHENHSKVQDLKRHRNPEAANDAALVARLQGDLIPIVKQDCSKPFLP